MISDAAIRLLSGRLKSLLEWRNYLPALLRAVEDFLGGAEVYVFGSVVEGGLTAASDVDVAIVVERVPESALERAKIVSRIFEALEGEGMPWWYPLEMHLMTRGELEMLKRGGARFVRARDLLSASP